MISACRFLACKTFWFFSLVSRRFCNSCRWVLRFLKCWAFFLTSSNSLSISAIRFLASSGVKMLIVMFFLFRGI